MKPGRVSTKFKCSNCFFSKVKKHVITFGRRIEDKFQSMNMELKNISVCFDCSNLHGNRHLGNFSIFFWHLFDISNFHEHVAVCFFAFCLLISISLRVFPSMLPAWMVVLASTLGCRQGTLFKAPRNAEVQLADSNVFCRNDWWLLNCCKSTVPLNTSQLGATLYRSCFLLFGNVF